MPSIRSVFTRVARMLRGSDAAGRASRSDTTTVEVDPSTVRGVRLAYAPRQDARADAGEIVWAWVPFAERDGRGKDRPVLVIAAHTADRVYAVKLTSRAHDGERAYVPIGAGEWDPQRRPSWVDVDQLYSVHQAGLRRQGAALDARRFGAVSEALARRYGWRRA